MCFKYGNISVTRLRYSANHNAPDSWPIRAQRASQKDELRNNRVFQKRGRSNNNVQYVENNVFLTLNRVNTLHYTKYTK